MSSASRPLPPELLAMPEARAARRGRAFAYLDATLERIVFANPDGEALFGARQGESPSPLLVRQVRSGSRAMAQGATFPLLVRTRAGASVAALAIRFAVDESAAVLLAACEARGNVEADPDRLLAAVGAGAGASLFATDGSFVAGEPLVLGDNGLRQAVAAFARSDATAADVSGARLIRVEDRLVLALPNGIAAVPPERPSPWVRASAGRPAEGMPNAASGRRPPLRSAWGPPADASWAPATTATTPEADEEPPMDETRQPVERESAVIVPDEFAAEPNALDPAILTDEESPADAEGELVPSQNEPGLGTPEPGVSAETAQTDGDFVARLGGAPVRFVWQIDADGRFRSLSPEFADIVGPRSAAVLGRSFGEVAEEFGFDESGAIRRLLERRDTWSGRTVLWPVEGTSRRVPVDLAALPTYGRDRSFDGFRGFGIVRSADHEADEAGRGLILAEPPAPALPSAPRETELLPPPPPKPLLRAFEADLPGVSFGRRPAPPQAPAAEQDLPFRGERRRGSETTLSEAEEAAFREIGASLSRRRDDAVPATTDIAAGDAPEPEPVAATPAPAETADASSDSLATFDIAPVLAGLPAPVLVQGRDALVFINRAFADWSGFADLAALRAAGGLEALFAEEAGGPAEGTMRVRRANGGTAEARVHMQRIAFAGQSSLLMTFEPPPAPSVDAQALAREVGELRAVLDIATDGVLIVDPESAIRAANGSAEALFGMGAAAIVGRPLADLFAHESRKVVLDYLETMKDRGLAGIMNDGREVIGRVAQGGFVPLFITVGRVPDERGWCVVIRDMSHWKRIEEELVNAKRAAEAASLHKSRFLANISHELRTPLNAIIGFADVMASECFGPIGNERYVEYLGDIKRSGHHVLDLVNDLLDISKIEAGRMELSFEAVSLNEVLSEVVATMQPQANRERVIVRSNLPTSVPPVVADRRTIRQIALNLLSNSVRFTPAGGQIIASTTYTAEGDVLLRVRDSGIGMSPSEIEIALTPFQQVHRSNEARNTGTGLGLPLTKAMAEANRASFAIRSTPGEGTLVEIAFPAQRVLAD